MSIPKIAKILAKKMSYKKNIAMDAKSIQEILNEFMVELEEWLVVNHNVRLYNFGIFKIVKRKPREVQVSRTQQRYLWPGKNSVKFKVCKRIETKLNPNRMLGEPQPETEKEK